MTEQTAGQRQAWRAACALSDALRARLPEAIGAQKGLKTGKPLYEVQKIGGEQVALALSVPLMARENRRDVEVAWINVQVSVAGNGLPLTAGGDPVGEAVVHVAHWACEFSFEYDAYIGFPATAWQPWAAIEGGRVRWDESESPYGDEWLYTLPLAALSDAAAIDALIVAPVLAGLTRGECAYPLPGQLSYVAVATADGTDLRVGA